MRFRAKITDIGLFIRLVTAIQKIHTKFMIHLSPQAIQFVVIKDVTDDFQVWAHLPQTTICSEYLIESMSESKITLEVETDKLLKAVKSGQSAHEITMKLTKKPGTPGGFLSFGIELNQAQSMSVVHDVPVELISLEQYSQFNEPLLPDASVAITLPPLKSIRPVVDHMKNVDQYLTIGVGTTGELVLSVQTERFSVNAYWSQLEIPTYAQDNQPSSSQPRQVKAQVDIKKFSKSLNILSVAPLPVYCVLYPEMVVLHLPNGQQIITYYIPAIAVSD